MRYWPHPTLTRRATARSLARLFRGGTFAQEVADNLLSRNGIEDADAAFARMEVAT
ncbi:hypothetical protein [Pseudarthrobacter sp. SSS035]|uniref:hypothetical protein n=1 Tax=Pseudarthrobacter sp. SSS035 TaxID=2931399 RepID=UPI00200E47B5|nr:hypothetical protein [Pseudarthrobacter sp. SSS035]